MTEDALYHCQIINLIIKFLTVPLYEKACELQWLSYNGSQTENVLGSKCVLSLNLQFVCRSLFATQTHIHCFFSNPFSDLIELRHIIRVHEHKDIKNIPLECTIIPYHNLKGLLFH